MPHIPFAFFFPLVLILTPCIPFAVKVSLNIAESDAVKAKPGVRPRASQAAGIKSGPPLTELWCAHCGVCTHRTKHL